MCMRLEQQRSLFLQQPSRQKMLLHRREGSLARGYAVGVIEDQNVKSPSKT